MPSIEVENANSVGGQQQQGKSRKSKKKKGKSRTANNSSTSSTSPAGGGGPDHPVLTVSGPRVAQSVLEIRQWLLTQTHLSNVRTDDSFILRFLRFQKFRLGDTKAVIDKYVHMRDRHPEWFRGLDIRDPKLRDLMSSGYLLVLPGRDPRSGRRVVFSRASAMDTSRFTACDVMRAHILAYEALLCDDDVQERGLTYVFDERDINWRHLAIWSPGEISKAFGCCERALPLRHQEIHFVHLPWTMNLVFQFAKGLLSQKLRDRFQTHSTFERLAEETDFPVRMLPAGYWGGGGATIAEMVRAWLGELEAKRDQVLGLDEMSYGIGGRAAPAADGGGQGRGGDAGDGGESDEASGVLDLVGSVRKMENSKGGGGVNSS